MLGLIVFHVNRGWITSAILTSIRRKNKLYNKFKSSPTYFNKLLLANYRNKLTNIIRVSKKNYYCNLLDTHKHNLKQTWKILNDLLGRRRKVLFLIVLISMVLLHLILKQLLMVLIIVFFIYVGPRLSNVIPDMDVSPTHILNNIPPPPPIL